MVETEIKYWRNVLIRVVATVKTLSSRGLPFRGSSDKFGSPHNGNYMMALELIAEFDPFLSSHIEKFGNVGKGKYIISLIPNVSRIYNYDGSQSSKPNY